MAVPECRLFFSNQVAQAPHSRSKADLTGGHRLTMLCPTDAKPVERHYCWTSGVRLGEMAHFFLLRLCYAGLDLLGGMIGLVVVVVNHFYCMFYPYASGLDWIKYTCTSSWEM